MHLHLHLKGPKYSAGYVIQLCFTTSTHVLVSIIPRRELVAVRLMPHLIDIAVVNALYFANGQRQYIINSLGQYSVYPLLLAICHIMAHTTNWVGYLACRQNFSNREP